MAGDIARLDPLADHPETPEETRVILEEMFAKQRNAFSSQSQPTLRERRESLLRLQNALLRARDRLIDAVSADYGCRSHDETLLAEITPTLFAVKYARRNLRRWLAPQRRQVELLLQPAGARVVSQPKGVVGIIAPWNYPIFLTLGPLISALSAGNRVMIKPAEQTVQTNSVLMEIITEAFTAEEVLMLPADLPELAIIFPTLPFDHLLFTGSTAVGRKVMRAASDNLTPVTLELGGKSPVIIDATFSIIESANRVLFAKLLHSGQTCVAPDYLLVHESVLDELVAELRQQFAKMYPCFPDTRDYSSLIDARHHQRLQMMLEDAREKGARVIELAEAEGVEKNRMAPRILLDVTDEMLVMQEEIFGPLLPIQTFVRFSEALERIRSRPRPLALYLFSNDAEHKRRVIEQTHAGGVGINDTMTHAVVADLPMGGIGPSGMGQYHGEEGFKTFSHLKPVFSKGRFNSTKFIYPPYGGWLQRLLRRWLFP